MALADAVVHEMILFAAIGFAIGGLDDFLVDALYLMRWAVRRMRGRGTPCLDDLPPAHRPGQLAIFVPAWDESAVIGAMLSTAAARFNHPDWRLYVGTYPNDRATIDAVAKVAVGEPRIRLVIGDHPGPTTKADCLNTLWRALIADEQGEGRVTRGVILHDAEDVVHRDELAAYARLLDAGADVVQLPVLPLIDRQSRLVAGHYADEFAEAHQKQMLVRQALGASMPLAGVGCAIDRDMLGRIASARGGLPFDCQSLTEDYELGLTIGRLGGRATFAHVRESRDGPPIAVRAYFPATFNTSVRQKSRWITGIALAGWDRTGWGRLLALGDHWMRMRDRRTILSVLVVATAYLALLAWSMLRAVHAILGTPPPPPSAGLGWLLCANLGLLVWRIVMRAGFVGAAYGRAEALWSLPRLAIANLIALAAARLAIIRYVAILRGAAPAWDKTAHHFPDLSRTSA